jgi:hypothetical protein
MEEATALARNGLSDLRGASRLAIDATVGLTGLVEALHTSIACMPVRLGGPVVEGAVNGVTSLVYRSIHGVTRAVGGGLDGTLARLVPVAGHADSSPRREAVVAALNGVLGDHLTQSDNPLAITMRVRRDGRPVAATRHGMPAAFPRAGGRIVVLVHGLCMNDLQWTRGEHDHGARLAHDLGYTPVYVHYNSGLHVSMNGRSLAVILEALVAAWPVPVEELAIVAHSMGGLVARSAHHHGTVTGHAWPRRLGKLVFLGTPHHGAPLERRGHRLHRLFESTPYTAPFGLLGRIRSAGITDLRHGSLLDEDWQGRDRFAHGEDVRRPVPLPEGVACFAIAGTTGTPDHRQGRLPGDGLVPVASALGRHRDPRHALDFPASHQWIAARTDHFGLLGRAAVYDRIRAWLAG